jgi:hypothetical protein
MVDAPCGRLEMRALYSPDSEGLGEAARSLPGMPGLRALRVFGPGEPRATAQGAPLDSIIKSPTQPYDDGATRNCLSHDRETP